MIGMSDQQISPTKFAAHASESPLAGLKSPEALLAYIRSTAFRGRLKALEARLDAGEKITEGDRADALGLPWLGYAVWRGCHIARSTRSTVRLEGEPGENAGFISPEKDGFHIFDGNGALLAIVPVDRIQ